MAYVSAPRVNTEEVVMPEPFEPVVEDDYIYYLYLRMIPRLTREQWIEKTGPLNDDLAHKIADAYLTVKAER